LPKQQAKEHKSSKKEYEKIRMHPLYYYNDRESAKIERAYLLKGE
jgi:hypothetical protein